MTRKTGIRLLYLWILILCLLFLSASGALAAGSSHIRCECFGPCTCFIQEGDRGRFVEEIISLLIEKNYLPEGTPAGEFTSDVTKAVRKFQTEHGLDPTGSMDDDTLTWLFWDMSPEELDRRQPLVSGVPATYPDTVYVPTDGGIKRHAKPKCSGMYDPRKVSVRNAVKAGFDACKKRGCEAARELLLH